MCAKLYLACGVRGQNFIKTKIMLVVIKLRDERWQMNRVPVAYARFVGHSRKRRYLDGASRQSFDVEAQGVLHAFEREPSAAGLQRVVAAACFERVITATRARVHLLAQEPVARPLLKLFDADLAQRARARTKAGERGFTIHTRHVFSHLYDTAGKLCGARTSASAAIA